MPGYTFRAFVTSCGDPPQEIWRDYNRRADMEHRIAELQHDLGAERFCRKQFFATEAAFRAVLLQNPPAVLFSAEREIRIPLLDSILNWQIPTSPKLNPALVTDPEPEP